MTMGNTIIRCAAAAALFTAVLGIAVPAGAAATIQPTAVAFSVSDETEHEGTLEEDPNCPPDITCRPLRVPTTMHVAITMNAALSVPVTVHAKTVNGTAQAGLDYVGITDQLVTIPAHQTTGWVNVQLKVDFLNEPAETFSVVLFNPSIPAGVADQGLCTILNGLV
jgi:hypothetical protein